jgi:hypothetical protein
MQSSEERMTENESEKRGEFHFIQLVLMFQAAAMQQMGKLENPITKKVERDLEQAKFSIDMLEMIQQKTKGNLSENEKKFLEHILFELRMNYVDEVDKDKKGKKEDEPQKQEEGKNDSGSKEERGTKGKRS